VDQLLQDEMPPGVLRQLGFLKDAPEVLDVAVQVARDEYLGCVR
jgi:hypothetical protein